MSIRTIKSIVYHLLALAIAASFWVAGVQQTAASSFGVALGPSVWDWSGIGQQAYLKASNPGRSNWFGFSVAISGDTVVVGAFNENSDAMGVNGAQTSNEGTNSGAAYVFVREGTNWVQQTYLKASNAEKGDIFGVSVAIDGDTIVVGASEEDSAAVGVNGNQADNAAVDSGAVYVFTRRGTNWSQQAYLKASNTGAGDHFGARVAIAGDTVVVGATGEDSGATGVNGNQADNSVPGAGAAYVFVRSGTNWSQQAYLKASNPMLSASFGLPVSISEETLVVGAPNEASSATGVNGNQNDQSSFAAGAAYVFVRRGTNWTQQAYLKASNTEWDDLFGNAVTVSGDTVVVGARFEDSAAKGVNGEQHNNLAHESGATYVFVREGTNWSQQAYLKASNAQRSASFGGSVALTGNTLVVGAFLESSGSAGVNGDQNNNDAYYSGAAYVFVRKGTNWSQQAYLKSSNPDSGDLFAFSAAISGNTAIIGALNESSNATGVNGEQGNNAMPYSGAAYIFTGVGAPPRLSVSPDGGGGYWLRFTAPPGTPVELKRAARLEGPWSSLGKFVTPATGLIEYHDASPLLEQGFYRAVKL